MKDYVGDFRCPRREALEEEERRDRRLVSAVVGIALFYFALQLIRAFL